MVAVLIVYGIPDQADAASYPTWWTARGVVATNGTVQNDYAAVNTGQLKWVARGACDEIDARMPLGAGAGSNALAVVAAFSNTNNYSVVNSGQLKAVAQPFYDRMIEYSAATNYPWTAATGDDAHYAVINLGQLKNVFSFDLLEDTDTDGLPDWWETHFFGDLDETGLGDFDGDGVSNLQEYQDDTDPDDATSRELDLYANCSTGDDVYSGLSAVWDGTNGPKHTIDGAFAVTSSVSHISVASGSYTNEPSTYSVGGKVVRLKMTDTVRITRN